MYLKRQNLKDHRLSSLLPPSPFIALCLEEQIPIELKHSCSSLFLHYKHLSFLKCQEPRTIPEINIVSLYVIFKGALRVSFPMIAGYFHISCHFKVKDLQGQSHHLSSSGFPDTQGCSEMASGLLHNKDLAPWHCFSLDLCLQRGLSCNLFRAAFQGQGF